MWNRLRSLPQQSVWPLRSLTHHHCIFKRSRKGIIRRWSIRKPEGPCLRRGISPDLAYGKSAQNSRFSLRDIGSIIYWSRGGGSSDARLLSSVHQRPAVGAESWYLSMLETSAPSSSLIGRGTETRPRTLSQRIVLSDTPRGSITIPFSQHNQRQTWKQTSEGFRPFWNPSETTRFQTPLKPVWNHTLSDPSEIQTPLKPLKRHRPLPHSNLKGPKRIRSPKSWSCRHLTIPNWFENRISFGGIPNSSSLMPCLTTWAHSCSAVVLPMRTMLSPKGVQKQSHGCSCQGCKATNHS